MSLTLYKTYRMDSTNVSGTFVIFYLFYIVLLYAIYRIGDSLTAEDVTFRLGDDLPSKIKFTHCVVTLQHPFFM